jgi:hypothetical protein
MRVFPLFASPLLAGRLLVQKARKSCRAENKGGREMRDMFVLCVAVLFGVAFTLPVGLYSKWVGTERGALQSVSPSPPL